MMTMVMRTMIKDEDNDDIDADYKVDEEDMMTRYKNNEDIGHGVSVDDEDDDDLLQRKTPEKCQHSNHFHGNT